MLKSMKTKVFFFFAFAHMLILFTTAVYSFFLLLHTIYNTNITYTTSTSYNTATYNIRELKQPRRRRHQKRHKFAYLTMKNSISARFARAFFNFGHFEDVLVLSTTWNDLLCSCVDDVNIWWQMFNLVSVSLKRWFQFYSRTVRTHFSSIIVSLISI